MAQTAEQVQAKSAAAQEQREAMRVQQERIRKAEQEREQRIAKEREAKLAAKKAAREAKAKERKANTSPKESPYKPGDGQTHATGKTRLGVTAEGGCVCGCGETPTKKRSRFIPGHDARMYRLAKMYNGKLGPELQAAARETITDRQKAYLKGRRLI